MDNQPQQPVMPPANDFLSRMDAASHPIQPEPEKKGLPKQAIIGIAVGAVALIAIIVVVVINLMKPAELPKRTSYIDDPDSEYDEEMEERNEKRKNDLVVLGEAVKKYQAQDGVDGQLPGYENSSWNLVISQYTPDGEVRDGADGELYKMGKVCKFSETNCMDISSLSWEKNKHEIYVMYNADCKGNTKENVIVSSTRKRHAAIFAVVEGDQFICATND